MFYRLKDEEAIVIKVDTRVFMYEPRSRRSPVQQQMHRGRAESVIIEWSSAFKQD